MHRKTVKLLQERLIHAHHLPPGTKVTLGEKEANALVKLGQAVFVPFDEDAVPPEPAKRPYIQTAAVDPAPRRAARIHGKAE